LKRIRTSTINCRKGKVGRMLRYFWFLVIILGLTICLPQSTQAGFDDLRKETLRVLGLGNDDLVSIAVLLSQFDDSTAEKLIGELGQEEIESQYQVYTDREMNRKINQVISRLTNTSLAQGYEYAFQFKVLHNSQINAYALPAGYGYINSGLLNIPMIRNDEIAFIIGHEMAHMIKRHGLSQLKRKYCLNLLTGQFTPEQGRAQFWSSMSQGLFTARQSQKHEKEADQFGLAMAIEAGYNPMAGLTFMRRLETLNKYRPQHFQAQLQQFFQTHPPTTLRSTWLKDQALKLEYGRTFREQTVEALGSNSVLLYGPFPAHNQEQAQRALRRYAKLSGNKVYHFPENRFSAYPGHCTWFCWAVFPWSPPVYGNGGQWLGQAKSGRWPTGSIPKVGSIMIWSSNSPGSGGCGHVAYVVAYGRNWVEVWDSNYGPIVNGSWDLQIRHRRITDFSYIIGYIYPKGSQSESGHASTSIPQPTPTPQPEPTPEPEPRTLIMIETGPIHLGDDEMPLETAWSKQFRLERYETHNQRIRTVCLVMEVKGLPNKDPRFSINRHEVGIAITATDQWQKFRFPFNPKYLKQGQNLVDAETVIAELYDSFDECQIRDIHLELTYRR